MKFTPENEVVVDDNFLATAENRLSLIEYCDGSKRIFKTSRSHCKSNELKFRREIVAYRLSRLLELDLVPETEGGEHRYSGCTELTKGIVQSFISASSLFEEELVEISEDEKRNFFEKYFPSLPSLCSLSQEEKEEAFLIMVAQKALGFPGMLPSAWPLMVQLPLVKENPKHLFSRVLEEGKRIDEKRAYQLVQQRQIVLGRGDVTAITIIDFSQPLFQETMAQAHLFDLLLGEMDRHVHNFIYEKKGENIFLPRLIDHERSFSISFNNLSCLPYAISALPQLIDHRLAKKILHLTPAVLTETLSGLLEEEVQALLQRFHQLQQHIIAVEKKHSLIDVWNEKTFQEQLRLKDNYLYREWNRLYQKVMASSRCHEFLSCLYHLRKINGL